MNYLLSDEDFSIDGKTCLYFYTNWMTFHSKTRRVLEKLEGKYPLIKFIAIDADIHKKMCTRYSVSVVPTIIVLDEVSKISTIEGVVMASAIQSFFSNLEKVKNVRKEKSTD